jgi:hypothetical protein
MVTCAVDELQAGDGQDAGESTADWSHIPAGRVRPRGAGPAAGRRPGTRRRASRVAVQQHELVRPQSGCVRIGFDVSASGGFLVLRDALGRFVSGAGPRAELRSQSRTSHPVSATSQKPARRWSSTAARAGLAPGPESTRAVLSVALVTPSPPGVMFGLCAAMRMA